MKKLLSNKRFQIALVILVLIIVSATYYFLAPQQLEIPLGFTTIGASLDSEGTEINTITDAEDIRLLYTTGLLVIENKKEPKADPFSIGGLTWYYRTDGRNPFKIVVVNGETVLDRIDNAMIVTNNCPTSDEFCGGIGTIRIRTTELKTIYVSTTSTQYVVINP